jgi:hypothetical protein
MKKGYRALKIRTLDANHGAVRGVEGKELNLMGLKVFQHESHVNGDIKVISEYATGMRLGCAYGTYKAAIENATERINRNTLAVTRITIDKIKNDPQYGVLNREVK